MQSVVGVISSGLLIFIARMSSPAFQEAAGVFARAGHSTNQLAVTDFTGTPVQGGLINHSYKINGQLQPAIFLQLINQNVFKNPAAVQENYICIWSYAQHHAGKLALPNPLFFDEQQSLYRDSQGNCWRAFTFIEEGITRYIAKSPREAYITARTFGNFTAAFANFNAHQLHPVIPNFHNLAFRYNQFENALANAQETRKTATLGMIQELQQRVGYKKFFESLQAQPEQYKVRVMHHDAKIANVLFHKDSGDVICAVDFDTVMPGYYFSDLGDMVRSMACNLDESSKEFDDIKIRKEYYEAILDGYLSVMRPYITPAELQHIHHAGILLIYMQALRFLSDYLDNDRYYRIQYPEQNKDRALNQLCLLKKLEQFLTEQYHYNLSVAD